MSKQKEISFSESKNCLLLFLPKKDNPVEVLKEFDEADFLNENLQHYYIPLFLISLKKLLPNSNLDKIISEFQDEYRNIEGIDNRDQHKLSILNYSTIRLNDIIYKSLRLVKEKKFHTITLLIMSFHVYVYYNNVQKKSTQQPIFDNRLQIN